MTALINSPITPVDLEKKVADYAQKVLNKNEHASHWHVLNILFEIPNEQRWLDQKDLPFIREHLLKKGIGKVSELKEYKVDKEKPSIPFHLLSTKRPEDPRDTCPECDIYGNLGCPQHREIVRNLF